MEEIISYLISPETIPPPISGILEILKVIFLAISLVLLVLIIFIIVKSRYLQSILFENTDEFVKFKPHGASKLVKEWKKINKKLESGLESEYKLAVIEADTMLGEVLTRIGRTEETIEEKIAATSPGEIKNMGAIEQARNIRNNIVYDPDYKLTLDKAKEALATYEEALKDLNVFS